MRLTESEPLCAQPVEKHSQTRKRRCTRHSGGQSLHFKGSRVTSTSKKYGARKIMEVAGRVVRTAKVFEKLERMAQRTTKEANATKDEKGDQGRGDYEDMMQGRQTETQAVTRMEAKECGETVRGEAAVGRSEAESATEERSPCPDQFNTRTVEVSKIYLEGVQP